ncbi:hypothetical protein [Nocardioides salsibiostraticola]
MTSNTTRLHRLETGVVRAGDLVDAYEVALGLAGGSLRGPIDATCRTFPEAPVDRAGASCIRTVRGLSDLTDRLASAEPVAADVWLTWARALAQPGAIGLQESVALGLILRLIDELGRSVGQAYPARYEALALLRCSSYGHLVLEAAQHMVADPHIQVLNDLMSAVGEFHSPGAVDWCLELLVDRREQVVGGAAIAIENLGQISSGTHFWEGIVDRLIEAHNACGSDSPGWEWRSHLLRLVPDEVIRTRHRTVTRPLAPAAVIDDWSREASNANWLMCREAASRIANALGMGRQPILARLMFDIAISPYECRAVTSYMLLGGIPALAPAVTECLVSLTDAHLDPVVRSRILRRLPGMAHGHFPAAAEHWLHETDQPRFEVALMLAGASGRAMSRDDLAGYLKQGGAVAHRALYAAAMSNPDALSVAAVPGTALEVQCAARWWQQHCGRITQ